MAPGSAANLDPWAGMVGQSEARARLETAAASPVHAYLFLGSRGSGTYRAALGFAGMILAGDDAEPEAGERVMALALAEKHPDLLIVEPQGATLRVSEAEEIIRAGLRTPIEGRRKVIVITQAEAMEEASIGKLLKVIEEPPPSAVFVLLAEEVPPEIITVASRCVTVEFGPLSITDLEQALIADGVEQERAGVAAAAAVGDLDRARLLATDDALAERASLWQQIPDRLDGTGYGVSNAVEQVRAGMDGAQGPLEAKHETELAELEVRVEQLGERGSGRTELVARQKREIRRLRVDELKFGLASLSRVYRDRLVELASTSGLGAAQDRAHFEALEAIQTVAENLIRNPNEALLLQDLFLRLSPGAKSAST